MNVKVTNAGQEVVETNSDITYMAPTGMITLNSISGYNEKNEELTSMSVSNVISAPIINVVPSTDSISLNLVCSPSSVILITLFPFSFIITSPVFACNSELYSTFIFLNFISCIYDGNSNSITGFLNKEY